MPIEARFDHPPVTGVELTVYLEAMPTLQVSHLASLLQAWQEDFTKTDELPPIDSWQDDADGRLLTFSGKWPFPTLWLGNEGGDRFVRIHHDRLVLTWRFESHDESPSAKGYPGYLQLKADLRQRYATFAQAVEEGTGQPPRPRRVEADYANSVSTAKSGRLISAMFGWPPQEFSMSLLEDRQFLGARIHSRASSKRSSGLTIGLDADLDGEANCTFRLISLRDISDDLDMWDAMDDAHDALLDEFLRLPEPAMLEEWGKKP